MLASFRDFLIRHRRKFIITGVLVGGTYIALKYAQKRLIDIQKRQAREFMEKTRRMNHFESTERTCNQAIIAVGTEMLEVIQKECSTTELLEQLREKPPNKLELWEEVKIVAFTRLTTFIYASSMLVVALRIQLNLLGGYIYCDTIAGLDGEQKRDKPKKINNDLKQKYLSLISHFIQDGGLSELVRLIRSKVLEVLKNVPLTKLLSLADMEQLFWSLQMSINSDPNTDPCSKISKYILPSHLDDYAHGDHLLQKMINETLDLLESDDASSICSNNISRGFSLALDAIAESMGAKMQEQDNNCKQSEADSSVNSNANSEDKDLFNINYLQLHLAKIIPIITGLTSTGFDISTRPQNLATSLITFYIVTEKCKMFGANVYETFSSA